MFNCIGKLKPYAILLLVVDVCFVSHTCYAKTNARQLTDEQLGQQTVSQKEIRNLTHIPQEYYAVWIRITKAGNVSEEAAQESTLLRIRVIEHIRKTLDQCNRKTSPNIPQLIIPENFGQPFRSGMDPAGITDLEFRKHYEDVLNAEKQTMDIMGEKADLESILRLFESLFVTASKAGIGILQTKEIVGKEVSDLKLRKHLLKLLNT